MATVDQKLIRDLTMLLQTRGVRLASRGAADNTDAFRVFATESATFDASDANKTYIVMEFDNAKLTALSDDKAFGAEELIVPDPDRL